MPHQCVNCGKLYGAESEEILKGCSGCKGKLFFFIKKEKLAEQEKELNKLSKKEKNQIINDVRSLIGGELDKDKPVVLDIESVKILKPGKYELDLVSLFKKKPLIFKLEEGKYVVDIIESFKNVD